MKTELNSKDYVSFARRFVKELIEDMDVEELRSIVTTHIHEEIQNGERMILVRREHLKKCKPGIRTYSRVLQRITI